MLDTLERLDLLVPLLTAHLLADFIFQTDRMAAGKDRWGALLGHVTVVAVTSWALIGHVGAVQLVVLVSLLRLLPISAAASRRVGIGSA